MPKLDGIIPLPRVRNDIHGRVEEWVDEMIYRSKNFSRLWAFGYRHRHCQEILERCNQAEGVLARERFRSPA